MFGRVYVTYPSKNLFTISDGFYISLSVRMGISIIYHRYHHYNFNCCIRRHSKHGVFLPPASSAFRFFVVVVVVANANVVLIDATVDAASIVAPCFADASVLTKRSFWRRPFPSAKCLRIPRQTLEE